MRGARFFARPAQCRCYALSILQVLFNRLPMIGYVIAAGLFAALSTFKVVGGIEGLASWTGVVLLDFL